MTEASTKCREMTKQASLELKMAKYSMGPGRYATALFLVAVGALIAYGGQGSTKSIIITSLCVLLAVGIVAYYRYITLPSFKKLYSDALTTNADGKMCIKDDHAYTELRDTYINRRRGSGFGGGLVGGFFGSMIGNSLD